MRQAPSAGCDIVWETKGRRERKTSEPFLRLPNDPSVKPGRPALLTVHHPAHSRQLKETEQACLPAGVRQEDANVGWSAALPGFLSRGGYPVSVAATLSGAEPAAVTLSLAEEDGRPPVA
jgi:hypothetical protein